MNVVETRVKGLILEQKSQQNIVILREVDGDRILPIWIGPGEAMAIRRILAEEPFPRPLTHDLLVLIVEGLKAKVARVVISDLKENTFFATVFIERESDVLAIDARPSDSIAVALRAQAPILVNEKLLQPAPSAETDDDDEGESGEEGEESAPRELTDEEKAEQLRRYLEKLNPEDFGKFSL